MADWRMAGETGIESDSGFFKTKMMTIFLDFQIQIF